MYTAKGGTPSEHANSFVFLLVVVNGSFSSCIVICMHLSTLANNRYWLHHVRMSAAPTGRMKVKFDIKDFYEKPSRISKFGYNWKKGSCKLYEDLTDLT